MTYVFAVFAAILIYFSLRSLIGVVTQHTVLFDDTIRTNIAYARPDAPLAAVQRAGLARKLRISRWPLVDA